MGVYGTHTCPGSPRITRQPWRAYSRIVGIDPLGSTPVYQQLAAVLRDAIASGRLAPDQALPSYMTLMQEHDVARGTAAKAVQLLVNEGLVRIVPGKGAYVVKG